MAIRHSQNTNNDPSKNQPTTQRHRTILSVGWPQPATRTRNRASWRSSIETSRTSTCVAQPSRRLVAPPSQQFAQTTEQAHAATTPPGLAAEMQCHAQPAALAARCRLDTPELRNDRDQQRRKAPQPNQKAPQLSNPQISHEQVPETDGRGECSDRSIRNLHRHLPNVDQHCAWTCRKAQRLGASTTILGDPTCKQHNNLVRHRCLTNPRNVSLRVSLVLLLVRHNSRRCLTSTSPCLPPKSKRTGHSRPLDTKRTHRFRRHFSGPHAPEISTKRMGAEPVTAGSAHFENAPVQRRFPRRKLYHKPLASETSSQTNVSLGGCDVSLVRHGRGIDVSLAVAETQPSARDSPASNNIAVITSVGIDHPIDAEESFVSDRASYSWLSQQRSAPVQTARTTTCATPNAPGGAA